MVLIDYLSSILGFERIRAGQLGIRHYFTIGLNSKEENNEELAEGVMEILPRFAFKDGVIAIGEVGYDDQTEVVFRYILDIISACVGRYNLHMCRLDIY